jgi:hypothetical protein
MPNIIVPSCMRVVEGGGRCDVAVRRVYARPSTVRSHIRQLPDGDRRLELVDFNVSEAPSTAQDARNTSRAYIGV